MTVDYTEPTGADLFINGHTEGASIVARLDRALRVEPGAKVEIEWRLVDASVFDKATGNRL